MPAVGRASGRVIEVFKSWIIRPEVVKPEGFTVHFGPHPIKCFGL